MTFTIEWKDLADNIFCREMPSRIYHLGSYSCDMVIFEMVLNVVYLIDIDSILILSPLSKDITLPIDQHSFVFFQSITQKALACSKLRVAIIRTMFPNMHMEFRLNIWHGCPRTTTIQILFCNRK